MGLLVVSIVDIRIFYPMMIRFTGTVLSRPALVPMSNSNSHVIVYGPALPQIIITLRSLLPSSTSSKQWCA